MYDVLKIVNWLRVRNKADKRLNHNIEKLTKIKTMKLLYFVQGTNLVASGKRFFTQNIIVWNHEPLIEVVQEKYKNQYEIVGKITNNDINDYKEVDNEVINSVYETLGYKSAYDLQKIINKHCQINVLPKGTIIPNKTMLEDFKKIVKV